MRDPIAFMPRESFSFGPLKMKQNDDKFIHLFIWQMLTEHLLGAKQGTRKSAVNKLPFLLMKFVF